MRGDASYLKERRFEIILIEELVHGENVKVAVGRNRPTDTRGENEIQPELQKTLNFFKGFI